MSFNNNILKREGDIIMTEGQMSKKEYEEKQEKLFKECTEQANKQRK